MIGVHIPLPTPYVLGQPRPVICHRCWSLHADITLLFSDRAVGWSCADAGEVSSYTNFFRESVPDAVLATNHLPRTVQEWFESKPCDLTREEAAAFLLYRMGSIPAECVRWLEGIRPRPPALGQPGDRVEATVTCVSVTELPATEWGQSFMITFDDSKGRRLLWRTGVGGLDARPGGVYNVKMTIKSHERFGGRPVTYVQRVKEVLEEEDE